MKYLLSIGVLAIMSCHSNKHHQSDVDYQKLNEIKSTYPSQILNSHVEALYDSAKWYLYTWSCDMLYKSKSDSITDKYFGELELKFDDLIIKNDTVVIFFDFMDNGQPILSSMTRDHKELVTGVGFSIMTKKKIYMVSSNVNIVHKGNPRSRFENPMQPEVITFIKSHKSKLDPWLRTEAKRRNIIPSS